MYRFKVSKYKNATPTVPKRFEGWLINNITGNDSSQHSNLIKASAAYLAYIPEGGNIGIANINTFTGKKVISKFRAHSETSKDIDFSPFDDGLLASTSSDNSLRVFRFNEYNEDFKIPDSSEINISFDEIVNTIKFHPTVNSLITSGGSTVSLWDITKSAQIAQFKDCNNVHDISWKYDGSLLAVTDQTDKVNVIDLRDVNNNPAISFEAHKNERDNKVLFIGDKSHVITSGFNNRKSRETFIWDLRSLEKPLASFAETEISTGVYIPLYDFDTTMLFLATKNGSTVFHWEVPDIIKNPSIFNDTGSNKFTCEFQIKGATLTPRRALKFMNAEVNRLILLGSNVIAPVSYKLTLKSYREFNAEIFPDTLSPDYSLTLDEWKENKEYIPTKISLNPSINLPKKLIRLNVKLGVKASTERIIAKNETNDIQKSDADVYIEKGISFGLKRSNNFVNDNQELNGNSNAVKHSVRQIKTDAPPRRGFKVRATKFRHLKGKILNKEFHITNLTNLCKTIPSECDGFKANEKFAAVSIGPNNNQLVIINLLTKNRRLPGGILNALHTEKNTIGDFQFDPFNPNRLVIGCSVGLIKVWLIPDGGLTKSENKPEFEITGHDDRVTIVKFHPLAEDVLASAGLDLVVNIWDLKKKEVIIKITTHKEIVFNMEWSPDGKKLATLCKDQKLRIFEPRTSTNVINEGQGCEGTRGGRVCWANNGKQLIVCGFSKTSERQIIVYKSENLSNPLGGESIDINPSVLIPFFDDDSSTLFLTGKGNSIIYAYEISLPEDGAPYVHVLSHFNCQSSHQAVAFLQKVHCDVRSVEFAKGYRLTNNSIEPFSFTVPRVKMDFFQDDIFPPTKVLWKPSVSSEEWFNNVDREPDLFDLRPKEMDLLSNAPANVTIQKKPTEQVFIESGGQYMQGSLSGLYESKELKNKLVNAISDNVDNLNIDDEEEKDNEEGHNWEEEN